MVCSRLGGTGTAVHLLFDDPVYSGDDGTGCGQRRREAAGGDGGVAVQVAQIALAQDSAAALQLTHIRPLVHSQDVRDACVRRPGLPRQLGKL